MREIFGAFGIYLPSEEEDEKKKKISWVIGYPFRFDLTLFSSECVYGGSNIVYIQYIAYTQCQSV